MLLKRKLYVSNTKLRCSWSSGEKVMTSLEPVFWVCGRGTLQGLSSRHNTVSLQILWGISWRAANLLKPSRLFNFLALLCTTTAPSPQPLHTPHFLDTPFPNCSHYRRLMSGEARASRCPRGERKRVWVSVFSLLNTGDWPLDQLVRSGASSPLPQPSVSLHLLA